MSRHDFLMFGIAASLGALGLSPPEGTYVVAHTDDVSWHAGQFARLIPIASHDHFLIKASFQASLARAPWLTANGRYVAGEQTDTAGRFWRFDMRGLRPAM